MHLLAEAFAARANRSASWESAFVSLIAEELDRLHRVSSCETPPANRQKLSRT